MLAWAKKVGVESLNELQKAYVDACEKSVMPPVAPDTNVLNSLIKYQLLLNFEACGKEILRATANFLEGPEAREKLLGIRVVAGEASKSARTRNSTSLAAAEKSTTSLAIRRVKLVNALGRFLGRARSLQDFQVHGLEMTVADCKALGAGIQQSKKLSLVSLADTVLGDAGFQEIAAALASSRVNFLELKSIGISSLSGERGYGSAIVRHYNFSHEPYVCGAGVGAVPAIARIVKVHGSRREEAVWSASLRSRPVRTSDTVVVADISSSGLLVLDVSGNKLDSASGITLANALESDSWVRGVRLGLKGQAVTEQVVQEYMKCLEMNNSLLALVLAGEGRPMSEVLPSEVALLETLVQRSWPQAMRPAVSAVLRNWRSKNQSLLSKFGRGGNRRVDKEPDIWVGSEECAFAWEDRKVRRQGLSLVVAAPPARQSGFASRGGPAARPAAAPRPAGRGGGTGSGGGVPTRRPESAHRPVSFDGAAPVPRAEEEGGAKLFAPRAVRGHQKQARPFFGGDKHRGHKASAGQERGGVGLARPAGPGGGGKAKASVPAGRRGRRRRHEARGAEEPSAAAPVPGSENESKATAEVMEGPERDETNEEAAALIALLGERVRDLGAQVASLEGMIAAHGQKEPAAVKDEVGEGDCHREEVLTDLTLRIQRRLRELFDTGETCAA